ncbi:MAG: hypothetical protein ABI584_01765, partial [Acidobacteriota bacterium]
MERVSRLATACALACFACLPYSASAGVFWKTVPAEGPTAPNVGLVLGDESRTLAFDGSGTYEFQGFGWHRIRLYADSGAEATRPPGQPFSRAGRFFALDRGDQSRTRLLRLEGDTWKTLFETGPIDTFAIGATRLFFMKGGFNTFCRTAICLDAFSEGIKAFSVAFKDGTLREEARSPACTGELHAAGDVLYLRALPAGCAGPSARRSESQVSRYGAASIPLYRLDGDHWTLLPPLDESYFGLFTTENDLWTIGSAGPSDRQVRRLTSAGLTPPVFLPRAGYSSDIAFVEWNGDLLYLTGFGDSRAFRLRAGAFEMIPAPFVGASYFVAGSRLFAAGTGSEVHLYNGSGWNVTPGIEGSPEAVDAFLAGSSSLFAVVGAEVWRREGSEWNRLPRPPLVNGVPRGFVFQNRPILVSGSRLLAFDGFAWTDLGPFEADIFVTSYSAVPPTLVTPNEFWISAQVDTLLRYRDGLLTTFHNSSVQSPPPGGPYEIHPTAHVREIDGSVVVFGTAGDAYRLAGGGSNSQVLVPAFPELTDYWLRDGASVDGRTFLTVQKKPDTASPPAVLVEVTSLGVRPVITPQDYQRGLGAKQGEEFLGTFGGALLL